MNAYLLLIGLVALERLAELVVSQRHARWAFDHGGVEVGRAHYPWMVAVHVGLLVGCVVETTVGAAAPVPWLAVPMLVLVLASQSLRWWCIATLGVRWNTRVIVVPGLPLVTSGPYRFLRHPNYVAVVTEIAALPLVHTAWISALVFSGLDALVLRTRIRVENTALATASASTTASA